MRRRIGLSGLPILAVAALLGCQEENPAPRQNAMGSASEEYTAPAQVVFLHDESGNVPLQVPIEMLQEMQKQLREQGSASQLKDLEARYDLATGEVLDSAAAHRAELFLKSALPQTTAGAIQASPLDPASLPKDIRIPEELIREMNASASAAKGGAQ